MGMADGDPGPAVSVSWARTGRHDWHALVYLLDAGERGRLDALRRVEDRERFVLAAALARACLAAQLEVPAGRVALDRTCARCGAPHGKPRLAAPAGDLELSITHSGAVVGVAVCHGVAVGLDVERLDRLDDSASLEASVLTADERSALQRMAATGGQRGRVTGFLRLWTRKEALTKMVGSGITVPLREVAVSGPDEPARCLALPGGRPPAGSVALHDLDSPEPEHVAAVAAAHPRAVVSVGDGEALLRDLPAG